MNTQPTGEETTFLACFFIRFVRRHPRKDKKPEAAKPAAKNIN
jgi:hypothetical protein